MRDSIVRHGIALSLALLAVGWMAAPASAQFREDVAYPGDLETAPPPPPPIELSDFICYDGAEYRIVWAAGYQGRLVLLPPAPPFYIPTGYVEAGGVTSYLVYHALTDPQDVIDSQQGPGYLGTDSSLGHRIVFWVDFNGTRDAIRDDQRFDGYLMTITRDALAGVTWVKGIAHGFYATDKKCFSIVK
jgi:hypothetical protein